MEENFQKEEKARKEVEEQNAKLLAEKQDLFGQLQLEKDSLANSDERGSKLLAQKTDLERQVGVKIFIFIQIYHSIDFLLHFISKIHLS